MPVFDPVRSDARFGVAHGTFPLPSFLTWAVRCGGLSLNVVVEVET